jgi:hypothetical protein
MTPSLNVWMFLFAESPGTLVIHIPLCPYGGRELAIELCPFLLHAGGRNFSLHYYTTLGMFAPTYFSDEVLTTLTKSKNTSSG